MSQSGILAIDTSSSRLRLAVQFGGDRIVKSDQGVGTSHGRVIMKRITDLLQSAGMTAEQLDVLAVNTGPGSFTGLRIGLAVAKGIAAGVGARLVGVSLFELAAASLVSEADAWHVLVPFKRDACFVAPVRAGEYNHEEIDVLALTDVATFASENRTAVFDPSLAEQARGGNGSQTTRVLEFDIGKMIEIAVQRAASGEFDSIEALEPLYVQQSQAEIRHDRRQQKRGD